MRGALLVRVLMTQMQLHRHIAAYGNLELTCHAINLHVMRRRRDIVAIIHVVVQANFADANTQRIVERSHNLGMDIIGVVRCAIGVHAGEILNLRNIPHRQNFAHQPVAIVRHAAFVSDGVEHRHQQIDARGFSAHERLGHFFAPERKQMRMRVGKRCQGHGTSNRLLFLGKRHALGIRHHGLAPGPSGQRRRRRASRRAW